MYTQYDELLRRSEEQKKEEAYASAMQEDAAR